MRMRLRARCARSAGRARTGRGSAGFKATARAASCRASREPCVVRGTGDGLWGGGDTGSVGDARGAGGAEGARGTGGAGDTRGVPELAHEKSPGRVCSHLPRPSSADRLPLCSPHGRGWLFCWRRDPAHGRSLRYMTLECPCPPPPTVQRVVCRLYLHVFGFRLRARLWLCDHYACLPRARAAARKRARWRASVTHSRAPKPKRLHGATPGRPCQAQNGVRGDVRAPAAVAKDGARTVLLAASGPPEATFPAVSGLPATNRGYCASACSP